MSNRTITTPTAIPEISPALMLPLTGALVGGLTDGVEVVDLTDGAEVVWGGSVVTGV